MSYGALKVVENVYIGIARARKMKKIQIYMDLNQLLLPSILGDPVDCAAYSKEIFPQSNDISLSPSYAYHCGY